MHTLTSPLPHHVLLVLDYPCGMCDMHIAHNASCCSICTLPSSSFLANYQICFYFIAIPAQIISGQLLHVTTLAHYSISLPRQFSPWPGDLSGLGVVPVNKITRYIVTIFTFYLLVQVPKWLAGFSLPRIFSQKRERLLGRGGKEKSASKRLMRAADGWLEWVTGGFGFLVPKTPSAPRIWISCPQKSVDSQNLSFLSWKLREWMHSPKLKATSLCWTRAKLQKTKL